MSIEALLKKTGQLMEEHPSGTLLWHRACGRRGVVVGWTVYADGDVSLRVDYGVGGFSNELLTSMSPVPVGDGTDDEGWKHGPEGSRP